eukprot:scaffold44280_cov137-Amphora_coffeaeformis.AAC.2
MTDKNEKAAMTRSSPISKSSTHQRQRKPTTHPLEQNTFVALHEYTTMEEPPIAFPTRIRITVDAKPFPIRKDVHSTHTQAKID